MARDFVAYLSKTRNKITEQLDLINDEYLDKYPSKMLYMGIKTDNKQFGGHVNVTDSDTDFDLNQEIATINETYKKLSKNLGKVKDIIFYMVMRRVRNRYISIVQNFLEKVFVSGNALYYTYASAEYYASVRLFHGLDYELNILDDRKSHSIILEFLLNAAMTNKYINEIIELVERLIQNNLNDGGNMCLYFFFAPWINDFLPFLRLLFSYFETIDIYYPLCMLTSTNRVLYICKNKRANPETSEHSSKVTNHYYDKMIVFSKKISEYVNYTQHLIRYMLMADVDNFPAFDVMLNKIMTHFTNSPDIQIISSY